MKSKPLALIASALAIVPCFGLYACTSVPPETNGGKSTAATKLEAQVTGVNNTYTNLYNRAINNGGLFTFAQSSAVAAASDKLVLPFNEQTPAAQSTDTTQIIKSIISTLQSDVSISMPSSVAIKSYVLDVFAYTQIASTIVSEEKEGALTQIYSVDYDYDDDFKKNMTNNGFWYPKIPEEISFAGYDEATSKVNIVFKSRTASDRALDRPLFEEVNSEMYYISEDNFGYAQITTRYDIYGNHTETGFDYCNMKDRHMIGMNFDTSGTLTSVYTYNNNEANVLGSISAENRTALSEYMTALQGTFDARTAAWEGQNLAWAEEAQIGAVQKVDDVYSKGKAEEAYKVTFDYELLAKMLGEV